MKRRIISIITALALCLSLCPTWAFAAEADPALCPHHQEHTGECGYAAPTEGHDCGHEHTNECYIEETQCVHVHDESCYSDGQLPGVGEEKAADACTHECTADTGCVTRTLDCHHSHDSECGYVPVDPGQPCGFVCRLCPIEDLIAALPEEVTEDNADEVRARLDEILALFGALTEDEQELVDISPCLTLQEQLDAASAASPLADTITLNSRITINSSNLNQYNNKVITGATTRDHLTINGVTVNLTIKDLSIQLPYSDDVNSGLVHAGIRLENNATLNLTLEGTNTIKGGSMHAAINVPAGCTLTISGSGSLTARGGDGSAGIGANFGRQTGIMTVGTININGGTIDAYGSSGGAGIGGTMRGSTGRVVINGGTVYAEGSGYSINMGTAVSAAGIGGGSLGKLESITITGGTVTARGHKVSDASNTSASAGIGAGTGAYAYDDGVCDCGDITITGGTIDAKGGGDYAIGFGANSGNQTGGSIQVSGSPSIDMNGGKMKPVPSDYIFCNLNVTIYDRSIVSDQSATLSFGCASWTGTLKKSNSEPYCGTLTASNLLVNGSGSLTLTVEAGGKTWTKEVSPRPSCSVIIGNQDYQKYSLTGTIYDGRITRNMTAASVTINGETHQVTLTRNDYQVSFSLPNLGAADASGAFPVTVTAGGITWTGTTSGGSNKTLTIGTKLRKVRLNFWDSSINGNISVQAQVSRRGSPLDASETVNDGTLHRTQSGSGYLDIWMVPGEDTTISVTVPSLNGGQAIEKTGLTIEARDMELDWYRGTSSDTPVLDLSKGSITFDGSNGALSVTYSDGTGSHTQSNLSYDALHMITQSDPTANTNYIVVKKLTQQLHIQVNGIHIDRGDAKEPSISVEANCTVELRTEGENTVGGKLNHAPVSVVPSATLILGGTGTLTVENRSVYENYSGAAIGGKHKQDSGKIIIESGTVVATSHGAGAAIGGGSTKKGTVEIRGGTVTATANSYAAAIGGGYQGAGTVKISGGQVNATGPSGASAIGGGTNGNGTVEISGGTVTATASVSGAAIGGGSGGSGTVDISGGIVKATANGNGAAIGGGRGGAGTVEISGGRVEATTKSGAAIGGGYQGAGTVEISGGTVKATANGNGVAIGGGSRGAGTVKISGGRVEATAKYIGAAIGGGSQSAGTVEISGGTITASSSSGDDVGNGYSGSNGSVTVTGGSIKAINKKVLSPTNGSVGISLVEITLPEGAVPADTAITSADYYGVKDVYPLDGNKLYFYLPEGERPTITVGDVEYVPDSPGSTNYIAALPVTLKDYPQTKEYDGKPVENPTKAQVSSSTAYDEMIFSWYQNGTLLTGEPVNAGSYALRVSNTQGIYKDFAVTITQRPLTITAQAQTIGYGGSIAQDMYTVSGLAPGDTVGSVVLTASQNTPGEYTDAIIVASAQIMRDDADVTGNYTITYALGNLTINKLAYTVNGWPTTGEITYGQALSESILTGGDTGGSFAWKDGTVKPSAGTAEFDVVFTPTDANYEPVTGKVSVTVNKAPLTVTGATAASRAYNGTANVTVTAVTLAGVVNTDDVSIDTENLTGTVSSANAGTYSEVTLPVLTLTGNQAGSYTLTQPAGAVAADVTISPLPITVTPDSGQSKEYGAADPALKYTCSPSLIENDQLSGALAYTGTNVGSYAITQGTLADPSGNYTLTITPNVMFEITRASSSVTTAPTATGITYGQALSDSTLTGGEGSVAGAFTWTDGATKPNAGTAQFSVTFTPTDTNYNTATADVSVTIAKATPTLTAPTASAIEYGQKLSDSALTGGTAINPNGSTAVAGSWSWVNEDTRPAATGTFPMAFVPGDTVNYNTPADVNASVTVNPAEPKITLTATPAQQIAGGKVTVDCTVRNPHDAAFSDSLPNVGLTYRIGSGAEQALTGDGFNIPAGTAVGTVITITATTTAVDGKYTAATRTATVTVTDKIPVTISGVRAQDGVYNGGTHNGYTGTPTASPYNGDFTYTYAKADGTALSGPPTNAGDYTVTISLKDTSPYIGSLSLNFTISKASITIKANDQQANVGSARPALTYTASGLASGDTLTAEPTLTCDADMSRAGRYTITASGGAVPSGGNYNPVITYVPGTLTVTDPTVHVTRVTLNKTSMTLAVGSSERLTATVVPGNATNKAVTWTSSNSAVARVDNSGNVTAVSAGSAAITVTTADGGKTAACTVTVGKDASTLTLTPSSESLLGGGAVTLTLTGLPTGGAANVTCSGGITVTKGTGNTWIATLPNNTATYTFTASFAGDASHDPASASCTVETRAVIILPDPPAGDSDKQFKLVMEPGISDVPAGLKNIESLNTPAKLETVLKTEITQATPGIPQTNTAVYNVALLVSIDGGATWTPATADNFPTGGLTITLPYPSGTNSSYRFTVVHMFTTSDFGNTPGDTEVFTPNQVKNTAQGIQVVVTGLSPISVGWTAPATEPVNPPSGGNHGGGGGGGSVSTYAVTVEKSEHGKVTSNRTNASSNSTVTLTVTPDSGYVLDTLTVTDSRGNEVKLTAQGGGKYTFTMPSRAVTVKASFVLLPDDTQKPCDGGADCPSRGFTDLGSVGTWYHEAVDYILRNGLMGGYGNGNFGPNNNLTRAQFAQILFNREGKPVVNYLLQYGDVAEGAWYTEAVRWATSQSIVGGYGNGNFGPNDNITREQLAVMLWRYAGSPAATDKELHFTDKDKISGYALEALRWAVENGIMNGKGGGILDPQGLATRAQTAQMLKNFLENRKDED